MGKTGNIGPAQFCSAQWLNLLVTECLYTARMLYERRVDALHFFLWRTSTLNIKHKTKPDRFRPFRLRVDGALFPIGHSDRRHLEFSVLLIFFRSKTGNYQTTGTLGPLCNFGHFFAVFLVLARTFLYPPPPSD